MNADERRFMKIKTKKHTSNKLRTVEWAKLALAPSDILVARVPQSSMGRAEAASEEVSKLLPRGTKLLVVSAEMELAELAEGGTCWRRSSWRGVAAEMELVKLGDLLTVADIMKLAETHPEKFAAALLRREQKRLSEEVLPVTTGKAESRTPASQKAESRNDRFSGKS